MCYATHKHVYIYVCTPIPLCNISSTDMPYSTVRWDYILLSHFIRRLKQPATALSSACHVRGSGKYQLACCYCLAISFFHRKRTLYRLVHPAFRSGLYLYWLLLWVSCFSVHGDDFVGPSRVTGVLVRQHYKTIISERCHKLVPILIWP